MVYFSACSQSSKSARFTKPIRSSLANSIGVAFEQYTCAHQQGVSHFRDIPRANFIKTGEGLFSLDINSCQIARSAHRYLAPVGGLMYKEGAVRCRWTGVQLNRPALIILSPIINLIGKRRPVIEFTIKLP